MSRAPGGGASLPVRIATIAGRICDSMFMRTKLSVIPLALALTLVVIAQQQNEPVRQVAPTRGQAAIIAKLSEIVRIRERLAQSYLDLLGAGRAPFDGTAEIELAEARIELARERGQPDAVITELKDLVAAHQRRVVRLKAVAVDRGIQADVDRAQAALLEAEVRLLRAQK